MMLLETRKDLKVILEFKLFHAFTKYSHLIRYATRKKGSKCMIYLDMAPNSKFWTDTIATCNLDLWQAKQLNNK